MALPAGDARTDGAPRRLCVEAVDWEMAVVLAAMSPADRLAVAFGLFASARRILACELAAAHPEWSAEELERVVTARLAHAG